MPASCFSNNCASADAMGCLGYNLRARMALAVLVRHAIVKRLRGCRRFWGAPAPPRGLSPARGFQIFQEEQPGSLLGVIQFRGASGFFAENIVDISGGLFKH